MTEEKLDLGTLKNSESRFPYNNDGQTMIVLNKLISGVLQRSRPVQFHAVFYKQISTRSFLHETRILGTLHSRVRETICTGLKKKMPKTVKSIVQ